jgi:LacI family transcriptional regulator
MRPTLDDVARKAGFSKSAVSLALRNSPKIPDATRAIIQVAARELGYRFDPVLAALAAHRWHRRPPTSGTTLAALADGGLEGGTGMVERAVSYGYRLEVFQIGDYPSPERLVQVLYSRGILGIVVGQIFTPGFCAAFDWSRFVIVACCEGYERPPVHLIMPNHFRALQEGWDHAWAAGHRRIGLALIDQPDAIDYHDRVAAYLERQQQVAPEDRIPAFKLHVPPRLPGNPPGDPEESHGNFQRNAAAMDAWLRQYRPDAVIGFSNFFLSLTRAAGWRVPQDVAFISLWKFEPDDTVPGMCLTHDEVGRRAVDWLDSLLRAGERGLPEHPITMSVDMRWQDAQPKDLAWNA